jgi:hypothetical protein
MPFLFVDYSQGAGGERFCAGLSQSSECDPLPYVCYENGRTKVLDVFDQEFLKPRPRINTNIKSGDNYTIVPCHEHTLLAQQLLGSVCSIRIKLPQQPEMFQAIKDQQIKKVLLTREPTPEYFLGLVKILKETCQNPDFVRHVRYHMLTVEIILLSQGLEPTQENIDNYIKKVRSFRVAEPDFDYDLIIPYEDLVQDPDRVRKQIKDTFGITVVGDWLESYGSTYSKT